MCIHRSRARTAWRSASRERISEVSVLVSSHHSQAERARAFASRARMPPHQLSTTAVNRCRPKLPRPASRVHMRNCSSSVTPWASAPASWSTQGGKVVLNRTWVGVVWTREELPVRGMMGVGCVHHSTKGSSVQVPGLSHSESLPYDYNDKTHRLTAVLGLDVCFVSQEPVHGEENVM